MTPTFDSRSSASNASIPTGTESIYLTGYHGPGDGGASLYRRLSIAPNPARPWQFQSVDGAWWELSERRVSVLMFGARGNGTTDDSAAFGNAASFVASRGGGDLQIPETGAAYLIGRGFSLGNGVRLTGSGSRVYPGSTATVAQWTATGAWLRSTDTQNPTVTLAGHGSAVRGINFIRTQAIPGGSFTPTIYPYEIKVLATFFTIADVMTVATTHDIWIAYTAASGGGTFSSISNLFSGGLIRGIKFDNVNDTMYASNIHHRNNYYSSDAAVANYIRANKIDWDVGYLDNIMVDSVEFFQSAVAIQMSDQTCLGNTHSLYNAQFSNVQFNLTTVAMKVAARNTTAKASLSNVLSQSYSDFGAVESSDTLFQLNSDNVDLNFQNFRCNSAGGSLMTVGGGSGGAVSVNGLLVLRYSAATAGQTCFAANPGSFITLYGVSQITPFAGAGPRLAGAGRFQSSQVAHQFFDRYQTNLNLGLAGGGTWLDLANTLAMAPAESGHSQARLVGSIQVGTAQPNASLSLRMGTHPEIAATGIAATSTGFKSFDTNWIDLTGTLTATLGRLQITGSSGVTIGGAEISLLLR